MVHNPTIQQDKATFQLSSSSKCCPLARTHNLTLGSH